MRSELLVVLGVCLTLGAAIKSEPVPADPLVTGAYKLVGETFKDKVMNPDTDVLVFFYAPWCGHCKKFKPTLQEFGRTINNNNASVLVAELDATANDWDRETFPVKGYPTLFLAKRDAKTAPVKFSGPRTVEGL